MSGARLTSKRSIVVGLTTTGLFVAGWLAVRAGVIPLEPEVVAQQVRDAGVLGPVVLFALLVLQCVVSPLPSEPLMMAAGYVYGPAAGFALSWAAVVAGAAACFALARMFGRPFVERFVSTERVVNLDSYVRSRGPTHVFVALLAVRLLAFSSFDLVSYGCGLLPLPFRSFLLASVLGVVPKAFAFTYLGANMSELPAWLSTLILLGTFGIVLLIPWLLRAWQQTRAAEI